MGLRVRKSINLGGGFRVNISKSGVGYSWGTKGFRVTKTAKGTTRTTASIPGTGISYVSESKNSSNRSSKSKATPTPLCEELPELPLALENKDIHSVTTTEYKDFVAGLQNIKDLNCFLNWGLLAALLFAPYFEWPLWILLVVKIWIRFFHKVRIDYQFEDEEEACSEMEFFRSLSDSGKLWRTEPGAITPSGDSGANISAEIQDVSSYGFLPFYLKTNIRPVIFKYKKEKIMFFPDKILIENKRDITAIAYKDCAINLKYLNFVYKGDTIPSDTRVIGSQYTYVNKNGTPDRRYKENPQYPVCLFVGVSLSFENINISLISSNSNFINEIDTLPFNCEL